jgi:HflK protein
MDEERRQRIRYFSFAALVGVLLLLNLLGVFTTIFGIDTAAILTVLGGYRIFRNAIAALLEGVISADLAICVAVIAALAIGEYLAAAEAMFIMLLGEGLEAYAAGRTSAAIHRFVEKMPRRARLIRDGREVDVDAATLAPGDEILVRAGERIPSDGCISRGLSSVDESTITGEPVPRDKQPGDEVFSGTLNGNGLLHISVTRAGEETTLARVIRLVEEAKVQRAPVERLADRAARYFLPASLLAAALTFFVTRDWLRTVSVLLVACPCALILATPTAMVAAIGGLARRGILVRGGTVLQLAAKIDTVLFDKTGTITEGRFEVLRVLPAARSEADVTRRSEADLLRLCAAAESGSEHVLARAIVDEAKRRGVVSAGSFNVSNARVLPGRGTECVVDGEIIRAGSAAFLRESGVSGFEPLLEEADRLGATAVLVAADQRLCGAILLRDRIREGAREAVDGLRNLGIVQQAMLTGDRRRAAEAMAREVGIAVVEAELLPEQKLDYVRRAMAQGRQVAMTGDGLNDAPALAAAHLGIAVAGASDITAEAADVVYMPHSLEKLPRLFEVSRKAVATAWQNIIVFAGVVNVAAVGLAAAGVLGPVGAVVTHQLSSLFVMLNSLRLLRVERAERAEDVERGAQWSHKWLSAPRRFALQIFDRVRSAAPIMLERLTERRSELVKPAILCAAALVALAGFYTLGPDEAGVIERFGRKIPPLRSPGLHYKLPWPVEKLTRVSATRVRTVEIGFRSGRVEPSAEPPTYEWNVQHRAGRFQSKPEESLMLSGDLNMIEVNAVIHYRLRKPDDFLFRQLDGDATVRSAAESILQSVTSSSALDQVLTAGRPALEARVLGELQARLDRYEAGIEVLGARLLDVHPSVEVVDAFREVSAAFEEKNRLINESEGYRNEQIALARGNAHATVVNAAGYSSGRKNRSEGDASRFVQSEEASRTAPALTETRLFLESMEQILPGKRKMIVDANKGRRSLFLIEDGMELTPAAIPAIVPERLRPPDN